MATLFLSEENTPTPNLAWHQQKALGQGEILVETRSHSAWGGAVTAHMYIPLARSHVWQQLTDYPRWVQYFPDVTKSEILHQGEAKRLYQVAKKAFMFLTAQVEIYLNVFEVLGQRIQFRLEKGTFADFTADLRLQDCDKGTLLTYSVQATPNIPLPAFLIQQAMHMELPKNMQNMRQVLCKS
ncbi:MULTISPECIES: SRPBCC family protein [unclassified Coleofasciculus]|uniref:SRPBCC family protein n=1 Tax=unclassified Coleofasciculus TaxID=2692782 RepID=UPI001882237B|nr:MULTISPECIES: SRPBCC family protein [unclassified Coleofasciculus]MBE9128648.1 SRPBCC family protein [Coleofasciculus sp. LEGE 07081]MBE9149757.1 SRPBCC family protein [Coleofasciculus sp. LEGE 07092]